VASVLQGAFLTFTDGPIEDKIRRVNRLLTERTEEGKYATIFYAVIGRDGMFRYVNAGHCAPFLLSSGENVQYLETTGVPAGLVEDAEFEVEQLQLRPFDRLVIYSDGVTDAQDANGVFFGRRRLRATLESLPESSAAGIHDAVLETLERFTEGSPRADDVTLLVLQYCPPA
jgi:sigma-B regulation protein RsbU (phosphoserine phosphatase)